ncbi:hypothetical protein [uncultured Desulfovibrio sp.]|uniref:hypothetical protein n=1 Tax=uncultured Desulfovibrio sp. TaxID=167968 RepID=UPI00258A6C88|nr:hypothetical protein [uncultured Desulfovibrio sp.]
MKIAPADIATIYAGFVENELAPKAASGLQRFAAYGSVFVAQRKATDFFGDPDRVAQLKTIGVMDNDGMIDLDYVREMASFAMQKSGGKVTAMGLILDQSDIDKLYQLGKAVAQQ